MNYTSNHGFQNFLRTDTLDCSSGYNKAAKQMISKGVSRDEAEKRWKSGKKNSLWIKAALNAYDNLS